MRRRILFTGFLAQSLRRITGIILAFALLAILSSQRHPTVVEAASGDLDESFGSQGRVVTRFFNNSQFGYGDRAQVRALAIQTDGRIVAAGFATNGPNNGTTYEFAMVRYHPDGSLDASFDGDGKVLTDFFGSGDRAYGALLQPDDKIVLAGVCYSASSSADFALARYNQDGSLDASFDGDGKVNTPFVSNFEEYAASIALAPDNKIVAGGWANNNSSLQGGRPDFAIARYHPDGSLDTGFDGDGKFTLDFDGINDYDQAYGVAVQANGKIIAVGYAKSLDGNPNGTHRFCYSSPQSEWHS